MAVHESTLLNPTAPAAQQGRKVYMLRAYIAMKNYDLVLEETTEKGPLPLRAMRVLAQYMRSSGSARADVVLRVLALLAEPGNPADVTVQLVAGTVLSNEGRHRDALRALKSDKDLDVCVARYCTGREWSCVALINAAASQAGLVRACAASHASH